jgi:hypothetical protein
LAKGFIATTLLMSVLAAPSALGEVPTTFSNGEVADANDINENFQSLDGRISSLESVPIDAAASAAAGQWGTVQLTVDCTVNPSALQAAWGQILISSPVSVQLMGDCKEPLGGISIGGHSIALLGFDPETFQCSENPTKLLPADPASGYMSVALNNNSSLWLQCLQFSTEGNVSISGYAADFLRMQDVKADSGGITVELRNGGVFRSFGGNQIAALRLKNNSTAELYEFSKAFGAYSINLEGSRLKYRYPASGTIDSLSLSQGSELTIEGYDGPLGVTSLTMSGQSFIYLLPSGYTPDFEELVIDSQVLTDGSAIFAY